MSGVTILFIVLGAILALQCISLLWQEKILKRVQAKEQEVVHEKPIDLIGKGTTKEPMEPLLSKLFSAFSDVLEYHPKDRTEIEVIHCKTKSQFDHVLSVFESKGWLWSSGDKPTAGSSCRLNHGDETCIIYRDRFEYSRKGFYSREGSKVISYEDFLKREGLEAPVREEIKKPKVVLANPKAAELSKKKAKKPAPKKPARPSKK